MAAAVAAPAASGDSAYRHLSLWWDGLPPDGAAAPVPQRAALAGDTEADVCIVGAGYTGLWTAEALSRADPALRVVVLEARVAGFGASGRNGGWCSALYPMSWPALAARHGEAGARAMAAALRDTVDEVGRFCAAEGVDAHYTKGGTLTLARSPAQLTRLRAELAHAGRWDPDLRELDRAEAMARVAASRVLGGSYTPHCATVHPARLVRGLADVVVRRGVRLHEHTPAVRLAPGEVRTPHGRVRADVVVRATEGFTAALPGYRRALLPVYSLMVATEPLPASFWTAVGWAGRATLTDGRHLLVYAARTADDRIAFGGRGAPYHFRSAVSPAYDREPAVFERLRASLLDLFPPLRGAAMPYRWGGPLGVPRDWSPSVGLDRRTGLGWAGGYVGDGVAASNLAGRTLADLVLGRDTELVHLPWVGHRSPRWEPEPLRWLGVNAMRGVMASADRAEARTGRPARRAAWAQRLLGG